MVSYRENVKSPDVVPGWWTRFACAFIPERLALSISVFVIVFGFGAMVSCLHGQSVGEGKANQLDQCRRVEQPFVICRDVCGARGIEKAGVDTYSNRLETCECK